MMTPTTTHISDKINELYEVIHTAHWSDGTHARLQMYKNAVDTMTALHALFNQGAYWFSTEEIMELMRMNEEIAEGIVEASQEFNDGDGNEWTESS